MAAAEARAVWQRTANRCFVQEDAKRAPKLACCQSSSTSKQVDSGPTNKEETLDHRDNAGGFIPFPRNDFHNLPSETRWWLQLQPGFGYHRGLDIELEILKSDLENLGDGKPRQEKYSDDGVKEKDTVAMMSSYEFVSVSKETDILGFDSVSSWSGNEKNEPWWRTTDKDDIALLVAKKALDYVENCDLPPPQKVHIGAHPYSGLGCFEHHKRSEPSLDWRPRKQGVRVGCPGIGRHVGMKWAASDGHEEEHRFDKAFSQKSHSSGVEVNQKTKPAAWEGDPSKAELLEALCHSQTRAREAEKAAKIANAEKEHIIKLFFRQASQLFAYKQWFQLLQLESMYLHIKDTDQFPAFCPWTIKKGKRIRKSCNWRRDSVQDRVRKTDSGGLFWPTSVLQKARPKFLSRSCLQDRTGPPMISPTTQISFTHLANLMWIEPIGKWVSQGRMEVDVTKYAVAIALGLGLVGAGLLLGWTVGWMFPPI